MREARLVGVLPDGTHVLVTLWADGSAEMATRPSLGGSWGPPVELQSADLSSVVP